MADFVGKAFIVAVLVLIARVAPTGSGLSTASHIILGAGLCLIMLHLWFRYMMPRGGLPALGSLLIGVLFAAGIAGAIVGDDPNEFIQVHTDGPQAVQPKINAGSPFGGRCSPVVTQRYGPTDFAAEPAVFGYAHFHTGIDLACPAGTIVSSVTEGIAHPSIGYNGGWGNNVLINFTMAGRQYWIRYAHLQTTLVGYGTQVHPGDPIGLEGSTGNSTGPHLHFEVDTPSPGTSFSVGPDPFLNL